MSPSSKSKSKDKKAGKEPPKGSSKTSGHVNTRSGTPASGYNPLLGTFHTFETALVLSASHVNGNGCFRNIDDTDDHNGNSNGTGIEYDCVSNNGSWSGESEDHKEKTSQPSRQESVPGADSDKREKIRQKNERKHQRQKERRAQELHDRCSGYLMSRKLEALAQKLVAMGFSHERATMALILNDGKVEESVVWLLEGGEEDKRMEHNLDGGGNLKIGISEELARITDMEIRYNSSKQEVERAIVACDGDLEKAEEILKAQKQEPPAVTPKPEETGDPPIVSNGKPRIATSQNTNRAQVEAKPSFPVIIQEKRDDTDFKYSKVPVTIGPSLDTGTKSMQSLKKIPPKMDWAKPQQITVPAGKRWPSAGSNGSVSYSSTSPLQASPLSSKMDARYPSVGNELKNLQLGSVREPVVVLDQPQTINAKQAPSSSVSSSPPEIAMGWYPNNIDTAKPNGLVPPVAVSRSLSPNSVSSNLLYNQLHYQSLQQFVSNGNSMDSQGSTKGNCLWSRGGASPMLSAASSLGLFSRLDANGSSSGSSSPLDWNTGRSMLQFDYTNVDWSLDLAKHNGLWTGANYSLPINARSHDSFTCGLGLKNAMRPVLSKGNVASVPAMQEGGVSLTESAAGGSREWTSPFEERDLFSLSRQFVSSPSM